MTFDEVLDQVRELLQRRGRVTYRSLKLRYQLDEEVLVGVTDELIKAERVAAEEDGEVLVWVGALPIPDSTFQDQENQKAKIPSLPTPNPQLPTPPDGERRQLTVMFCDLVGSTALSAHLDPEELREVVRAYQTTCAAVISRFEGHIAQYLGDGLLVYFGYPAAHEDDAQRAVRAGLGIVGAIHELPLPNTRLHQPLQVRIGIHTGPVVVGEVGGSEKREMLALGETPNLAARLQGLAEPDTVVISGATYHLVQGLFECQDRGPQEVKGSSTPLPVYRVVAESAAQSRFEAAVQKGLTPLIGREHEVGLLQERWERTKQGEGQVVLLSGEAGIGKSRLVQALKDQIGHEGATHIEFRCSPYHQNSALYPIIDHLQRLLRFAHDAAPAAKLENLHHSLSSYRFLQADTVPLLAALLSLPHPEGYPPITVSPQKQKEKTQEALVAWLVEEAERQAVYCAWEDLHWADPSTLEVLTLFLDQVPTTRLLAVLTFRPDFTSPWRPHSHITQLTLSRLGRPQVEAMVGQVTGGKALPTEVLQQIVAKTDGVPLFVEELTKSVIESVGAIRELPLQLGIPATLHDALMARLDRLGATKEIAQLSATLGREFSYELLRAVSPLDEATLQHGLKQLVEAELVYQRGLAPQATYLFKHALIQDAAYHSLLKSTRQQYHRQIAQVLADRFLGTVETQPELLAYHYTEAGLIGQAIPYWQQAGQQALKRGAYAEAISHLTRGLELLKTLPDTPEHTQQEISLQIALGGAEYAAKGQAAPEVGQAFTRAWELCHHLRNPPQLLFVQFMLSTFYQLRGELQTGRELAEQLLPLAYDAQNPTLLLRAHTALGNVLYFLGKFVAAREHLKQGFASYVPQKHSPLVSGIAQDLGGVCVSRTALTLWFLGYPDQALLRSEEGLTLAQKLANPFSQAFAHHAAAGVHQERGEMQAVERQIETLMLLSHEQGFPYYAAWGTTLQGWMLAAQGQGEDGIAQMRQGLTALRTAGDVVGLLYFVALLAESYGKVGQPEEGLNVLTEAFAVANKTGERFYEAELYRLKGELVLQSGVRSPRSEVPNTQPLTPSTQDAEACFLKAIEIARRQSAKSLELRAVMSLSRLWQQQGKKEEARQMLAEVYGWFTEGFDTKDLQEAKALLAELSHPARAGLVR